MDKIKLPVLLAMAIFLPFAVCFGETIILKSGQRVEGKIIEQTNKYVKIDFFGVGLVYYNDEIDSILYTDSQAGQNGDSQAASLYQAYLTSLASGSGQGAAGTSLSTDKKTVKKRVIESVAERKKRMSKLFQKLRQEHNPGEESLGKEGPAKEASLPDSTGKSN
ncbi:MAG: hypothetical protein PHO34_02530 [Candidatus Omnitrophica bacterium]|nr:hypothetical protein [Candidatus Omnitrophota bacterium]MDD5500704.1 hypothetical protein [Candidatus Omnitrophota bacterium]